jgi:hypothetical protein
VWLRAVIDLSGLCDNNSLSAKVDLLVLAGVEDWEGSSVDSIAERL